MSSNTPYEQDSAWPTAIGLTTLSAGGFGIYKYNTSPTFRDNITNSINKHISRVEKTPRTSMQEGVNIAAEAIRRGEAKAAESTRILRTERLVNNTGKYDSYKFSRGDAISRESLKGRKTYGFSALDDIKDINDKGIANDLIGAITDRLGIGREAITSTGVEGNNLIMDVMLGGGKREKLTVPLWQREGESWIHRGKTTTVGKLSNVATRNAEGNIVTRITDPNSGLLQAIDNTKMFDYHYELSRGGKDSKTAARNILNLSSQELIEEEKRKMWALKRVISTYSQSAGEQVASMELNRQGEWLSKQIRLDPLAAHNIGFGDVIGSNIADFGEGGKASGYNGLLDYAKHLQGIREGREAAVEIASWNRETKSFSSIPSNNLSSRLKVLSGNITSEISSSLSQGQTGEGTATFFNVLGDIHAPEALKSVKGYYYDESPTTLNFIKTNKSKKRFYNSASRTAPQYELPKIQGAQDMIESMRDRGHINVPMQLSPFHDEAIILQPRVLNRKIGRNLDLKLDELVTEGDSPVADIFRQILEDPEYKIVDGINLKLDKGTVLGRKRRTSNIRTRNELRLNKANEFDVITSPHEVRITSSHLRKFQELNRNKGLDESFVLPVEYIDRQIKGGNLTDNTRGSFASATGNTNLERYSYDVGGGESYTRAINNAISDNLGVLPEGEMSFNHFKSAIPKIEKTASGASSIIYGKGRGAYLGLLRGLTLGNTQLSNSEMLVDGAMKDLFLKHTNIETLYRNAGMKTSGSLNIGKAQRELGGLSFKRVAGDLDETIKEYQQMAAGTIYMHRQRADGILGNITKAESEELLGRTFKAQSMMQKYTQDQVLGKQLSELPEELQSLVRAGEIGVDDLTKLNYLADIVPHEARAMTLGRGTGVYRQSSLDLSLAYDMPAVQEELSARNQVQSTKLIRENKLMMKSASSEFGLEDIKEFEEATGEKLKVLEAGDIQGLLNDPFLQDITEATSAVKSPDTFFNSIFSPESNPNGFLLRTKSAKGEMGHFYLGSGDLMGGMISLQDGTYRPAKDDVYTIARALASASETGVVQGRALEDLIEETGRSYVSNMKNASAQIEGRMYDKLIDNQFIVNSHRKLAQIKGSVAEELDFITGSVTLQSPQSFEATIARQIEDASLQAGVKGNTTLEMLDELLGEGNDISSYMRRAGKNQSAIDIAKGMSLESQQKWASLKGMVGTEIDSAMNEHRAISEEVLNKARGIIQNSGSVNFWDRTPNLYPKSANVTFGFVDETLNEWNIAGGHVVKELMNADTDGDAIRHMMLFQKNVRTETAQHISRENKLAYDFMTKVSEQKLIKQMVSPASSEFTPITDAMKSSYSEFMKSLETEQAAAAYITKNITGVATTRAWTQLGYYEDILMNNKNASEDTIRNARYFLNTFVSKTGPQSTISAKLARGVYSPADNSMLATTAAVLDNLGTVDAASLERSVKDLGEVHNLTTWIMTDLKRPNNAKVFKGLNENNLIDDMGEVLNFQHNWKRITDEQAISRIHSRGWLGAEGLSLEEFTAKLMEVQNSEKLWVTENEALLESGVVKKGQNLIDWLSEPIYKVRSESTSWTAAESVAIKNLRDNNPKNYQANTEELIRSINSSLVSKGLKRNIGEQAILGVKQAERRVYPFVDKAIEYASKHMTPKNLAIGAGVALAGFAALNLISGDGTPTDINDIPSYNNPSFHSSSYGGMSERYTLQGGHDTNVTSTLLTKQGEQTSLMGRINSLVGIRGYNSSTLISDGSSPYKQDMHHYGA